MLKNYLVIFSILVLVLIAAPAFSASVYSANGFVCGKEGSTVTCKGPIPGGSDTVTGTGHNIVYLTVNTTTAGQPARYTYFSDTGCLIGYTFNAAGHPVAAVARHRSGEKETFNFGDGKYEKVIEFCGKAGETAAQPKTAQAPSGKSSSKN